MNVLNSIRFLLLGLLLTATVGCSVEIYEGDGPSNGGSEGNTPAVKGPYKLYITQSNHSKPCVMEFDENGKLSKINGEEVTWLANKVITPMNEYRLSDDRVSSFEAYYYEVDLLYNPSKQLKELKINYSNGTAESFYCTWNKKNQITEIELDGMQLKISYANKTCKGNSPISTMICEWLDFEDPLFIAHPELVGINTNQLPKEAIAINPEDGEQYKYSFEYELSNDGYVNSLKVKYEGEGIVETITWDFEIEDLSSDDDSEGDDDSSAITGLWMNLSNTLGLYFDGKGNGVCYVEDKTNSFKYIYDSKTGIVNITEGYMVEEGIKKLKFNFITDNVVQFSWYDDGEWISDDEYFYRH